ncbi:PAS domain-containing sensor histidine kinase [Aquabacterium sp. A7-Y]|uniref:PAS domain-containing sensor histidine kinase n=1 Tax=Aquabacterium sp. A7-Y TaxID=1349605 RepID=UPI00223D8052|nr:PAS domain-containing sensor histidine kinase [Aquabacterium sp. A7-Y]MCW7541096.1 PAS domain-containing sensor histidine kinase [Aquabacterium sp. A7-Y]
MQHQDHPLDPWPPGATPQVRARRGVRLLSPFYISLAYAVLSIAWITVSDHWIAPCTDAALCEELQTVKGIGFVCVTALLLYLLVRGLERRLRVSASKARQAAAAAQRSARELENVVTLLPEAVLISRDRRILYANRVAQDLLDPGGTGALRGSPLLERFVPEYRAEVEQRVDSVLKGGARDLRFMPRVMQRLDGSRFEALLGISLVHVDDRPAVLQIVRNLDEVLLAQREAEQARAELAALSSSLIEVQERERRSIARELHDEIGQSLSAIRVQFAKLQRRVQGSELLGLIESAASMTESTLGRVRSLSLLLHPPQLETLGLEAALRWHLNELRRLHGANIRFITSPLTHPVHPDVAIAAYRIVQEALSNALRHAQATRIDVRLHEDAEALMVDVEDDGIGFLRPRGPQRPTLGLLGMEERARLLGGGLSIDSRPGSGTRIEATLPWKTS